MSLNNIIIIIIYSLIVYLPIDLCNSYSILPILKSPIEFKRNYQFSDLDNIYTDQYINNDDEQDELSDWILPPPPPPPPLRLSSLTLSKAPTASSSSSSLLSSSPFSLLVNKPLNHDYSSSSDLIPRKTGSKIYGDDFALFLVILTVAGFFGLMLSMLVPFTLLLSSATTNFGVATSQYPIIYGNGYRPGTIYTGRKRRRRRRRSIINISDYNNLAELAEYLKLDYNNLFEN